MSLTTRKKFFRKLSKRLNCKMINDLMIEVKIEDNLFSNLYNSVFDYVRKCSQTKKIINSEKELFNLIKKKQ